MEVQEEVLEGAVQDAVEEVQEEVLEVAGVAAQLQEETEFQYSLMWKSVKGNCGK